MARCGPPGGGDQEATVAAVTRITELVLDRIDLTALVRERVDGRRDRRRRRLIDAIIARIDPIGPADQIIDGGPLPAIIRESTGTVTRRGDHRQCAPRPPAPTTSFRLRRPVLGRSPQGPE